MHPMQKMTKNLIWDPILVCLAQNCAPKISLASLTSTSSQALSQATILCNLKENKRTKPEKMAKNNFKPDFGSFWPKFGPQKCFLWVSPLLDVKHCFKLSLYAIQRKTNK